MGTIAFQHTFDFSQIFSHINLTIQAEKQIEKIVEKFDPEVEEIEISCDGDINLPINLPSVPIWELSDDAILRLPWTDEEILDLRQLVLFRAIATIEDGRCSKESRTEALRWIMDDSVQPFSFSTCCQYMDEGYVDHEEFRNSLLYRFKKSIKQ
ncbi:MAG: hypothetical protein EOO52_12710 [Gammaproteobacteria bacterium]|nr:MAG: hypothetical protein EOO52_12710 [Gammaproteobacteria bacterium]